METTLSGSCQDQNKLCQFTNWGQIAAKVITERVLNREHKRHAGNVLGGGQEN